MALEGARPELGAESPQRTRLHELDLLRFAAALGVVFYHYGYRRTDPFTAVEAVVMHGYLGVNVFFVISGFVVLWSCRGRTPARFLRARVLRLYPEFWISVLVSTIAFALVPGGFPARTARDVVLNLTMVPPYLGAEYVDQVYWTLLVELKFYALLWLLLVLGQIRRVEIWLYGWLALTAVRSIVDLGPVSSAIIFPWGALFASGGLFFLTYESGWTFARLSGLALGLALSMWHAVMGMSGFVGDITPVTQFATAALIACTFAFFAGLDRWRLPSRATGFAMLAGALTYPVYLLHSVGREIFLAETSGPLAVTAGVAFSLALSYAVMRTAGRFVRPVLARVWDGVVPPRFGFSRPQQ